MADNQTNGSELEFHETMEEGSEKESTDSRSQRNGMTREQLEQAIREATYGY